MNINELKNKQIRASIFNQNKHSRQGRLSVKTPNLKDICNTSNFERIIEQDSSEEDCSKKEIDQLLKN